MAEEQNFNELIKVRLAQLPKVVQQAIAASDIQKNLRGLSSTSSLHIDQWESLEHVVMLTLLGIHPIEELEHHISSNVEVSQEVARELAEHINKTVFEPIREELERQLEHPDAQAKEVSEVEAVRDQARADSDDQSAPQEAATPAIQPATPPAPAPEVKVARPAEPTNYKPGETSAQRAAVHDDPYREPPV